MYRDWSTEGLLGCNTGINLNMVLGTRKSSNTIKNTWIIGKNMLLACNEFGCLTFAVRHFRPFLDTYTLIWDLVFVGWSVLLVIRLALGWRYSNLVWVCIMPRARVVTHDNKTLPLLLGTWVLLLIGAGIWMYQVKHTRSNQLDWRGGICAYFRLTGCNILAIRILEH